MVYLRIILFGLLAFVERHPWFCLLLLLIGIFAPALFKVAGWIILGVVALFLIILGVGYLRMRKMQREMEEQMRGMGTGFQGFGSNGGNSTGFQGFSYTNFGGMSLKEVVRRMQAEADARQRGAQQSSGTTSSTTTSGTTEKRISDDVGDYVEFEEVKER